MISKRLFLISSLTLQDMVYITAKDLTTLSIAWGLAEDFVPSGERM